MSSVPPVYCPECHSEYLGTATLCSECGVALVNEAALSEHSLTAPLLPQVEHPQWQAQHCLPSATLCLPASGGSFRWCLGLLDSEPTFRRRTALPSNKSLKLTPARLERIRPGEAPGGLRLGILGRTLVAAGAA